MRLPPPQSTSESIIQFIDTLEDECYRDPNRAVWQLNKQRWLDLYTGNHFADPLVSTGVAAQALEPEQRSHQQHAGAICKLVYNRVMNAVLAMLAGQVSNPPKVVFGARENGESPIYYLNGFVQNPQLAPIAMAAGEQNPQVQQVAQIYGPNHPETQNAAVQAGQSVPLTPDLVSAVQGLIDQGKIATMQARMAGMPPPQGIVPPEALVEITDQTAAQFTQTIFDALWEQCGGIEATSENILNKKVLGWQATIVETDRTKICYGGAPITLTNMEGTQVFFDPMTSSFRPPRYVIMKEPVSFEEAVAKYPDLDIAGALSGKFRPGTLNYRARDGTQTGRLFNLQYSRDMCVVRTLWYCDWPYPMDPDEAMACGAVQIGQVPIEQPNDIAGQLGNGPGLDNGNAQAAAGDSQPAQVNPPAQGIQSPNPQIAQGGADANGSSVGSGGSNTLGTSDGIANGPAAIQHPMYRQAFLHSQTGEEVNPQHPNWPIIYGIREIRDIEGEVVFDRRRKGPMPIANNINIPIPCSPYGFGEPDRLDGLQMAINRVLSDLVTHHRYNTYPPQVTREEIANKLSGELKKCRVQPNTLIVASRDVAESVQGDLSKLIQSIETPLMSADAWKLLEFLVDAIDKEANNTDVQQGAAPAGTSGEWVANLQAAANQVAQVTSKSTESWLKQIVRLFVDFIVNEMTTQDVQKYTNKYPPAILDAFKQHQKSLYLDISVEVQSGTAAAKQNQTNSLIQAKSMGVMVADPEIMNRMGVDPDDQLHQQASWNQKLQEAGLVQSPTDPESGAANNKTKAEPQVNAA